MCRQGGGSNTMIEVERRKVGVLLLQRWEPLGNLVLAHEVLGVPVVCVQGAVFATARVALLLRRIIFRYFHSRHAARTQAQQKYCPLFSAHCYPGCQPRMGSRHQRAAGFNGELVAPNGGGGKQAGRPGDWAPSARCALPALPSRALC